MKPNIEDLKHKIVKVLKKNNVARAGIFGSYARGEQKKGSDIDILIEVKGKKFSLIDLIGLEMKLRKATKKKVDLLTYNGISPYLRNSILKEEVKIL
ncbi:MAG: nucleotidyltransferase family protein [Nanoarchaeota archaeon]